MGWLSRCASPSGRTVGVVDVEGGCVIDDLLLRDNKSIMRGEHALSASMATTHHWRAAAHRSEGSSRLSTITARWHTARYRRRRPSQPVGRFRIRRSWCTRA
jgi:hypothetical protein